MALVWNEQSCCTGPSLNKRQKTSPPKQNIVLFLHISTKAVASLCLHPNFTTNVGIMYSIESDDVFLEITIFLGRKKSWHTKKWLPFCKAITSYIIFFLFLKFFKDSCKFLN